MARHDVVHKTGFFHNVLRCRERRTEARPWASLPCREFREVWTCIFSDMRAYRHPITQTDRQTYPSQYFAPLAGWGRIATSIGNPVRVLVREGGRELYFGSRRRMRVV